MTTLTASRLLPLEGGLNLRDLGGYPTMDGRTVKHGLLFRSGMMSMLTEEDERHLVGLGIATVCDLRRAGERRAEPTRWCEPAGVHYWARDHHHASGVLSEVLRGGLSTPEAVRETMVQLYRDIPADHAESYAYMFERLLGGHVPLLFNCAVGKDRTGVAALLILTALGVPREVIIEDYLLTNEHLDFDRVTARTSRDAERFRAIDPAILAPLIAADTDYLTAMLEVLDRDHGGIDGYLLSLGVDEAAKAQLRERLLD